MAIQVWEPDPMSVSVNGRTFIHDVRINDMEKLGFRRIDNHGFIYVIERTNDDGSPFVSNL